MRRVPLLAFILLAACRQATAAEVGAHAQAGAQSAATIAASEHGASVNPGVVPAVSRGLPIQQAPMR